MKFSEYGKEKISRKYHISYDKKDNIPKEIEFTDYKEAREYLLCVLSKTQYKTIHSFNESSLVVEYEGEEKDLFEYLNKNLKKYFNFTISLVSIDNKNKHKIFNNRDVELDSNFEDIVEKLDCKKFNTRGITNYNT